MRTEEKEIIWKIINKIRSKKIDDHKEIKLFMKKNFNKEKIIDLTKKEKTMLLEYVMEKV